MVVLDKEDLDAFIVLEIFISDRPPPPPHFMHGVKTQKSFDGCGYFYINLITPIKDEKLG